MTTDKQIEANRRNAQKSTGPRDPEGKATAARNHMTHGLRSKDVVLYNEDPAEYEALCREMIEEHRPETADEMFLINLMASARWRLRRAVRAESGLYSFRHNRAGEEVSVPYGFGKDQNELARSFLAVVAWRNTDTLDFFTRAQTRLERSWFRALRELQRRQAARKGQTVPPPITIEIDNDAAA